MRDVLHPCDPIIFATIKRLHVRSQDFDDAAQECRLALLERPDYNPHYVVLQRCALFLRRLIMWREHEMLAPAHEIAPAPDRDARLDAEAAMVRLPRRWARLLRLQAEGWTPAEIAAAEGCTRQTVNNIIFQARHRLRA